MTKKVVVTKKEDYDVNTILKISIQYCNEEPAVFAVSEALLDTLEKEVLVEAILAWLNVMLDDVYDQQA